jgi:hypothetical protein
VKGTAAEETDSHKRLKMEKTDALDESWVSSEESALP